MWQKERINMIKIYTISSCTSCKKQKHGWTSINFLIKNKILVKNHLQKKKSLLSFQNREWCWEHRFKKNRYAKALNCDIDELSVSEVIDLIQENPRILKSPILIDDKRLQVGYKEDDIRAFYHVQSVMSKIHKHACVQHYKILEEGY